MVSKSVSPSAVQSVLCNLTVALGRTMQTHSMWTPTKVSDMLFGLNQISSATYSKELMKLLPLVTKCVNNCGVFTSREVMCCAYTIYAHIHRLIHESKVGRAFYGLKNMSIRAGEAYPALETLLGALTDQLAGTTELDSRELGMVLYSLNGMGSHSAAVRRVLACVASKLPGMKSTLDAQAIGEFSVRFALIWNNSLWLYAQEI